jgi:glucosamine--fructose-6-phosphate aminotransferase (isomerizing)
MLGAYLLALGLGRRRDVLSQDRLQALLVRLQGVADAVEGALGAGERILQPEAGWLAEGDSILFLGAGPQYASALFGAAKLYEGAQLNGVAQNIEEWAHAQYFISGPASRIVLLAPRGRSLERAYEIAREMRYIEAPFLVITDDDPPRWQALTSRVLVLPSGTPEVFSPLLFAVPLSQIGYYLAKARGKQSYNFPSPEREREHYETLHESPFYDFSGEEPDR